MSAQSKTHGRIFLIGDDLYVGGANIRGWVAMPKPTWEGVVTKRIVADTLSHAKGVKVALLASQAHDDSLTIAMKDKDIADERTLKNASYAERDEVLDVNRGLVLKVGRKNKTIKILIGPAIYGCWKGISAIAPDFLPVIP